MEEQASAAKLTVGVSVSPFLCITHVSSAHAIACNPQRILVWWGMMAGIDDCNQHRHALQVKASVETHAMYTTQPCPSGLLVIPSIAVAETR
jgi:hypothetical protein